MEAKYPAGLFLGREMTPVHLSKHPKAPILANTLPLSPCFPSRNLANAKGLATLGKVYPSF